MKKTYRVYFRRIETVDLYIDLQAESEDAANLLALNMTEDGDDMLTRVLESYDYDCSPTGEVEIIEGGDDEE